MFNVKRQVHMFNVKRQVHMFNVKRQVHLQAKSTAQSANREKSPKLASEPQRVQFSGGLWVPDAGPNARFSAGEEENHEK